MAGHSSDGMFDGFLSKIEKIAEQGTQKIDKMYDAQENAVITGNKSVSQAFEEGAKKTVSTLDKSAKNIEKYTQAYSDTINSCFKKIKEIKYSRKEKSGNELLFTDKFDSSKSLSVVTKKLREMETKFETEVRKHTDKIADIRSEIGTINVKETKVEDITKGLYDAKLVKQSAQSYIKELENQNKHVDAEMKAQIEKREQLYMAMEANRKKIKNYEAMSPSATRNEQIAEAKLLDGKLIRMIQHYNQKIGDAGFSKTFDQISSINITDFENAIRRSLSEMLTDSKSLKASFGELYKEISNVINGYNNGVKGLLNNDVSKIDDFYNDTFKSTKKAKKEIAQFNEELKNTDLYVKKIDKSNISNVFSGKGYNAATNLKNGSDSIRNQEGQYEFVGQAANYLAQGGQFEDLKGGDILQEVYEGLIENVDLKALADGVTTKVKQKIEEWKASTVQVPEGIQNPVVVDKTEIDNINKKAKATNEAAGAQEKLNNETNEFLKMTADELLSHDFGQGKKKEATEQLAEAFNAFKDFYGKEEAASTEAGVKAAYAYYSAYENALHKEVAESKLQRFTLGKDPAHLHMSSYNNSIMTGFATSIDRQRLQAEELLKGFKVPTAPLSPEVTNTDYAQREQEELRNEVVETTSTINNQTNAVDNLQKMYNKLREAFDALPKQKIEEPDEYVYDWSKAKNYVDFSYNGEDLIDASPLLDVGAWGKLYEERLAVIREAIQLTYKKIKEMQTAVEKHGGHLGNEIYDEKDVEKAKQGLMGLFEMYVANDGDLDQLNVKMTKPFKAMIETVKETIAANTAMKEQYDTETKEIIKNNRNQIESYKELYKTTRNAFIDAMSKDKEYKYKRPELPWVYGDLDYNEYKAYDEPYSFESICNMLGIEVPQAAQKAEDAIKQANKSEIASNEEVIASEEKKRKLRIANKEWLEKHPKSVVQEQTGALSGTTLPVLQQEKSKAETINEDLEKQSELYRQIYERVEKIRMLGTVGANKNDESDIVESYGKESRNAEAFKMQMDAIKTLSPTGEMNPDIRDMVLNSKLSLEKVTKKLVVAAEEYVTCKQALDDMFTKAGITGGKVYDEAYRNLSMYSLDSEKMFGVVGETREKLALIKSENAAREEAKKKKEAEAQAQAELNKEKIEEARVQAELTRQKISGEGNQTPLPSSQQQAETSSSTTATVVENENKKQKENIETAQTESKKAKAVEEAADKIVSANKKVKKSNDDIKVTGNDEGWGKITTLYDDYGEDPFSETKQKVEKTKSSYRTTVEMWGLNKDGDLELQTVKIIEDMNKLANDTENAEAKVNKAQAALKNFMATFNNKTLGQGNQLHGYEELSKFNIVNISDIETASTMMKQLDAEYNRVVQDFRKGTSSMNPFVNAINNTSRMGTAIESLFLDYQNLKVQTTDVGEALLALDLKYQNLMTSDNIYDRARLFGELKVSINEVTDAIKIQKKEEALNEKYDKENSRTLLLNEKKNNKVNELIKLENHLVDSGKMTDEVRAKLDLLFNNLSKASNNTDLSVWNEQLRNFKASVGDLPQTFESAWNNTLAKINNKQGLELDKVIGTNSIQKTIENNVGIGHSTKSQFKDSIKGNEWTGVLAGDAYDVVNQYNNIVSKMKEVVELRKLLRKYENDASKNLGVDYSDYINNIKDSISALIGELKNLISDDFFSNNQDVLGEDRIKKFANLYDKMEAEQTNIDRDRQKRQLEEQKQALVKSIALQKQAVSEFNDKLQGTTFDGSLFKDVSIDKNGEATITFLEIIGDKAVETKVHIDDVANALMNLQNGTFSFDDYKTSYNTRNVTKGDLSGINQNDHIQAQIDAYQQLYKTEKQFKELELKVNNNAASKKEIESFNELVEIRKYYNKVITDSLDAIKKLSKEEQLYYDKIGKAAVDKEKDKYDKYQINQQGKYNAYDGIYKDRINSPEIQNALSSAQQLMSQISAKNQNMDGFGNIFDNATKDVNELNAALRAGSIDVETYNSKVQDVATGLNSVVAVIEPQNTLEAADAMQAYAKSLPNAEIGKFNETNNTLQVKYQKQKGMVTELTLEYDKMTGAIHKVKEVSSQSEGSLGAFLSSLKNRARALVQYLMTFASFYRVVGWIRQGVTVIRELDSALTEMRKVSDESTKSLKNFQKVSFDIGNEIGATAAQIQNSAADFMRLGYSLQEAAKLSEDANIYANVGDMEIEEATEHMISSIKAWESEFESEITASEAIIDRYNEIGNNFAISSADIGSAMERSAAALKAGGNTLNESLGLITAGNIIQQDAETTAAALKIMSLRIRGSKAELDEMGESTDGLASSTSKLRDEIKALTGVDIMLDENTYKSTAQIIQEIGASWDKLTDVSQAKFVA